MMSGPAPLFERRKRRDFRCEQPRSLERPAPRRWRHFYLFAWRSCSTASGWPLRVGAFPHGEKNRRIPSQVSLRVKVKWQREIKSWLWYRLWTWKQYVKDHQRVSVHLTSGDLLFCSLASRHYFSTFTGAHQVNTSERRRVCQSLFGFWQVASFLTATRRWSGLGTHWHFSRHLSGTLYHPPRQWFINIIDFPVEEATRGYCCVFLCIFRSGSVVHNSVELMNWSYREESVIDTRYVVNLRESGLLFSILNLLLLISNI